MLKNIKRDIKNFIFNRLSPNNPNISNKYIENLSHKFLRDIIGYGEIDSLIQKNTELKNYSDLYKQYFKVEKENQDIKKIVEMQNRKNCLNYGNKKIFQNYLDNPKTMKNLGKFDLEKEENFVDLGFFSCGVTK